MNVPESIKRMPWTCTWGRFGGPVAPPAGSMPGFWICGHPETTGPKLLDRGTCEACPRWEPTDTRR